MADTLPFLVQITADGKYLNIRIPVTHLPEELRRQPASMNVRLMPESLKPATIRRWMPPFLLALAAR